MTDDDEKRSFWQTVESCEKKVGLLAAVLGSVATIFAFLETTSGPFVLALVILVFVTGHAFWEPYMGRSAIMTPYSRHKSWQERLRKAPCWGWISLGSIPVLIFSWGVQTWYPRQGPYKSPDEFTILVADFHQIDTQMDPAAITDKLIHDLRATLADEPKVKVIPLCQPISIRDPSDKAYKVGMEHRADIVIWGVYAITHEMVDLWTHFEVIEKPTLLPPEVEQTGKIGMEVQLHRERWDNLELRNRVVSELTYLTMFTLGLVRYEEGNIEYANNHFSSALTQVGESPMQMAPLGQCVVYFYRGKTHYDMGHYDRAITDFDEAIWLCPDYAAAFNSRGSAHHRKGDREKAIADWNNGTELGIRPLPNH